MLRPEHDMHAMTEHTTHSAAEDQRTCGECIGLTLIKLVFLSCSAHTQDEQAAEG